MVGKRYERDQGRYHLFAFRKLESLNSIVLKQSVHSATQSTRGESRKTEEMWCSDEGDGRDADAVRMRADIDASDRGLPAGPSMEEEMQEGRSSRRGRKRRESSVSRHTLPSSDLGNSNSS